MKIYRNAITALLLAFSCMAASAQTKITDGLVIDKTVHNFGDILLANGPVSCQFSLKNTVALRGVVWWLRI